MPSGQSFDDFLAEEYERDPLIRDELEDAFEDMRLAVQFAMLRESRGISQQELSRLSGISQPMISRIERGDQQPTWPTIRKLQAALGAVLISEPRARVRLETIEEVRTRTAASVAPERHAPAFD